MSIKKSDLARGLAAATLCLSSGLSGCALAHRGVTRGPVAPSARPSVAQLEADRRWMADVDKAAKLIDKPKQAAVDAFGTPTHVDQDINYLYPPTYEYSLPEGKLSLLYNSGGTLDFVDFSPAAPIKAQAAWKFLVGNGSPKAIFTPIWDCKHFLMGPQAGPCALGIKFKDKGPAGWPVVLAGTTSVTPWTGRASFDVNTNSTNIATLSPNPSFQWGNVDVTDVLIGRQKYPSMLQTGELWPVFSLPLTDQNVEQS